MYVIQNIVEFYVYYSSLSFHFRYLRCTDRGLNVVDSIVPELLNVMDKYFELENVEHEHL